MASLTILSEKQKVGVVVTAAGIALLYFGVMMYFDQGLLLFGNALLLVGLAVLLGFVKLAEVLLLQAKLQGSGMFFGGMFLVYYGFCIVGILLELYGAFLLFGGFVPIMLDYLRQVPLLGRLVPPKGSKEDAPKNE